MHLEVANEEQNVNAIIASVLYQLHSKEPLFKRCISMSGTPVMLKPLPCHLAEMAYTTIVKQFALDSASAEERIRKLKTVGPDELVEKTPMSVPLLPLLDGDVLPKLSVPPLPSHDSEIVPQAMTFAKLGSMDHKCMPGMEWCEELMIGDCQHDGSVFLFMGLAQRKAGIASALETSLQSNLPASAAKAVLQAYGIELTTDDDEALKLVTDLATDIAYVTPAIAYAQCFPKSYYYQFNELNPWNGPLKGYSTHMLDAAFFFQNFNEHIPPKILEVAKSLAIDFVKFANGVTPWVEYTRAKEEVRVYGPSDTWAMGIEENNGWGKGRRDTLWKLSEEGKLDLDQLSVAWNMFVAGR
jgi:carboxylesterase type B